MIDRRLMRIAQDPVRLQVLTLLNERSASVTEIAEELEIDRGDASRHLDALHDEGMVEVVGEVLGRGAIEPCYRALVRTLWDDEEWLAFSLEERDRLTRWILDMIDADAREALEHGMFAGRVDSHASRAIPTVDEQGWEELHRIYADALDAVFAVEAASAERLAERGAVGFPVLAAMLCCELPPRARGADGKDG